MNIYHKYHHNLILSDSTVIGPLTQWLAIVALKVCCPLACSSKQPTNKILSPAERWTEKASREEKDKNVIVKDDGVDRGKGTSVWRLPSSFLPPVLLSFFNLPNGSKAWVTGLPAMIAVTADLP